jgi:hypothetical protein
MSIAYAGRDAIIRREPWLGGPNTILPSGIESFACWSLAISCLSVSGYHYVVENFIKPYSVSFLAAIFGIRRNPEPFATDFLCFPCWLPLMTFSRSELERATPRERFDQFTLVLSILKKSKGSDEKSALAVSDDELVLLVRNNVILRRLASLAMRPPDRSKNEDFPCFLLPLGQQLVRIWPYLLALPPIQALDMKLPHHPPFAIALIVPCYLESPSDILQKLEFASKSCQDSKQVQVVVVMAGVQAIRDKEHLLEASLRNRSMSQWGEMKVVEFLEESGRGPCLNFGAQHANAYIYAFCHSDTRLPHHWDVKLLQTLYPSQRHPQRTNSCAFGFGIDTTPDGLRGGICPPGIGAIETTANLRCRWWSLPYGDQCLSLRAVDFHYLGGFPHQCFMEDYEFIALLRKRVRLLPKFAPKSVAQSSAIILDDELLTIVPGPPALCSPRRWQKFGVFYVTYTNSKLVNLYAKGMTPDELYHLYYGQALATRSPKSPWEVELDQLIKI